MNKGQILFLGYSCVRDLADNLLPTELPVSFTNVEYRAFPGATFDKLADKIDNLEYDFCPQCLVVIAGSNDLSVNKSVLKEIASSFYSKLRKRFPNSFIIASSIENRFYNNFNRHCKNPPI